MTTGTLPTPEEHAWQPVKVMDIDLQYIPVRLVHLDVPFGNLVGFLVKLSFAAIPAAIIVALVYVAIGAFIGGLFGALKH